jgi:hypothetical protein
MFALVLKAPNKLFGLLWKRKICKYIMLSVIANQIFILFSTFLISRIWQNFPTN